VTRMAASLRDLVERGARHHVPQVRRGIVLDTDPLIVELLGSGMQLEEEQLEFGYSARLLDQDIGIEAGDTVVLAPTEDGLFHVLDVAGRAETLPVGGGGGEGGGEGWFSGTGAPSGALGTLGDWYINDANGDFYEKTGATTWTLRGNLQGPQGAQGVQGPPGPSTGPAGGDLSGTYPNPTVQRASVNDFLTGAGLAIDLGSDGATSWLWVVPAVPLRFATGNAERVRVPSNLDGFQFGSALDTNLYRSAANELKTDDSFVVAGARADAPTPPVGANDTRIATTAFVKAGTAGYYSTANHPAGTTISIPQTTHGLRASRGLLVQVQDDVTGAVEFPDIVVSVGGDVTVTFAASVGINSKRVTVIG
jgi:hypothetical protein